MGTNPDGLGAEGRPISLAPDQVGGVVVGLEALDEVHLGEQTFSVGDSGFASGVASPGAAIDVGASGARASAASWVVG
jgi:hypothetical protein